MGGQGREDGSPEVAASVRGGAHGQHGVGVGAERVTLHIIRVLALLERLEVWHVLQHEFPRQSLDLHVRGRGPELLLVLRIQSHGIRPELEVGGETRVHPFPRREATLPVRACTDGVMRQPARRQHSHLLIGSEGRGVCDWAVGGLGGPVWRDCLVAGWSRPECRHEQ